MTKTKRFAASNIVVSSRTVDRLPAHLIKTLVRKHYSGDWGEQTAAEKREAESALKLKKTVVSLFRVPSIDNPVVVRTDFESDWTTISLR